MLEDAILDAAWAQLVESGYASFTYEAIATRAGTSRPVLYRRWPTRGDLLVAVMRHAGLVNVLERPDTGSLRDDAIAMLTTVNEARAGFAALISVISAGYFSETGMTFADLRASLVNGPPRSGFATIVNQAAARGELNPALVPERVVELPIDLLRQQLMMTFVAVPNEAILEIVDRVWLPLMRHYGWTG